MNRASILGDEESYASRQLSQVKLDTRKSEHAVPSALNPSGVLPGRSNDAGVDVEDRPLGAYRNALHLQFAPFCVSAHVISETAALLEKSRKPTLPDAPGESSDARGKRADSTASSRSFVTAPLQRQLSVVLQQSNTSTTSKKRKIDLSDDEESGYTPPSPSSIPTHKRPSTSLRSPFKKPSKTKEPPPPSASTTSTAGKQTNRFGFRAKSTASPSTPSTPPPSAKQTKPTEPITPTRTASGNRDKALSTPPSKRKAAVRARSSVQKMMEADEAFRTEDETFLLSDCDCPHQGDKSTVELRTRLRSMSITPVPVGTRFREDTAADESVYTREKFLKDRAKGADRLTNQTRNIGRLIGEESDEDYEDIVSELLHFGGVILMKGQENRLTDV